MPNVLNTYADWNIYMYFISEIVVVYKENVNHISLLKPLGLYNQKLSQDMSCYYLDTR